MSFCSWVAGVAGRDIKGGRGAGFLVVRQGLKYWERTVCPGRIAASRGAGATRLGFLLGHK
jgi:hypothetical protein